MHLTSKLQSFGAEMNKDNIEGKAKDTAGRAQRQAGEWSGDKEQQARGAGKQAEGKAQDVLGKGKEAGKEATDRLNKAAHDLTDRNDKEKDAA
jgi:uncharacterized protein YjbJ (UPF0337 family)